VEHRKFTLSDGSELRFGLALWSTGNISNPLIATLTDVKKDRTGRVVTDEFLRVPGATGVYAIGDCATIEGMHSQLIIRTPSQ
jgi:NADH dehydrogenase FAD-containing subunit